MAAYSSKGLREGEGRGVAHGHTGHMRHCVGFGFRLTASRGKREAEMERMLGTGNYQHDSRVMTLIVGAAHDTRDGKVNTKCCSCCALLGCL